MARTGGSAEDLITALVEARELVKQAHEANKDLRQLMREAREFKVQFIAELTKECQSAARRELEAAVEKLGPSMVEAAQDTLVKALRPEIELMREDINRIGELSRIVHESAEEMKRHRLNLQSLPGSGKPHFRLEQSLPGSGNLNLNPES